MSFRRWVALVVFPLFGCSVPARQPSAVRLVAREYTFDLPDTIPAGLVQITLVNGGTDLHEALITRLDGDSASAVHYVDSVRAHITFPAFAHDLGGPGLLLPGDSATVWLELKPGRYAVVCWMGDHLERGMARDLIVTGASSPSASPPSAESTIELNNYAFGQDRTLRQGRQVIQIVNRGNEFHEAGLFRLPDGVSAEDELRWLDTETGPSPGASAGGIGDIPAGDSILVALDLKPGRYLWFCSVRDAAGTPHYRLGMVSQFKIE